MLFLQPNQKRFLSTINPLLMVAVVMLAITLRTTVDPWIPLFSRRWDVLLAWVVYMGQRRTLVEGGVLTLLASHLYSLASSAPFGVFLIYYVVLFFVARLATYVIYANRWHSIFGLLLALSLCSRIILWIIAFSFGHPLYALTKPSELIGYVFFNAFMGVIIYSFVGIADRLTFKVPRINIEMAEGEL